MRSARVGIESGSGGVRGRRAPRRSGGEDRRRPGPSAPTTAAAARPRHRGSPPASRTRPHRDLCARRPAAPQRSSDRPAQDVRALHDGTSPMPGCPGSPTITPSPASSAARANGEPAGSPRTSPGAGSTRRSPPGVAILRRTRRSRTGAPVLYPWPPEIGRQRGLGVRRAHEVHRRPLLQSVDHVVGCAVPGEPGSGPHGQRRAGRTHGNRA